MSSVGTVIIGGVLGAGITYAATKPKITRLEKENSAQAQQINTFQNEVQMLRNTISSKDNIIAQKNEVIRQKDAEINKLKEERKRVLSN